MTVPVETRTRLRWNPILSPSSALAEQSRDAIDAVARAVASGEFPAPQRTDRPRRAYEELLLYGYLALAHHDRAYDDQDWNAVIHERLGTAVDRAHLLAGHFANFHLALYGGLCGLGWTAEHLARTCGMEPAPGKNANVVAKIDAALLGKLRAGQWRGRYDLITGLVGFGVYFLERWPSEASIQGIALILDHLEASVEGTDQGVTWHTGPELLPAHQREICPNGYYNLGVAHGLPGILYFLAETAALRIDARALPLLEGAIQWLIAQQRPNGSISRFGSWISDGESSDSRLAWCYGDLGIVAVLLTIAKHSGLSEQSNVWREFSRELLDHCLQWPAERSGVRDAPLCHGAAGVAHIFNRIYQSENDPRCRDAAIAWFERALAMRREEGGIGGFVQYTKPDPKGPPVWEPSPAFLDGATGIALALLAATTSVEPNWDRLMLLSGRFDA